MIERLAGGALIVGEYVDTWRDARGFARFHPLGKWRKCPDCLAAVPHKKAVLDHMELHRRAGDYDVEGDEQE